MEISLTDKIIQTLLYFGEATKIEDISKFLKIDKEEIINDLENLKNKLNNLNFNLVYNEKSLEIVLSPFVSSLILKNKVEELNVELSESSLQTLSVILYRKNATKAEIDFIRGVDSIRSIKNLLLRGLIEKIDMKNKKFYIPTIETLKYLNLNKVEDLEDYETINQQIDKLLKGE